MQLKVECTWNEKKNKGTQIIRFDHKPQSLFAFPADKIDQLQKQLLEVPQIGPPIIKELESSKESYPKSLYIYFHLYRVYEFFEYTEEKDSLFKEMKKKFPNELVVKCIEAHNFLKDKDLEKFVNTLQNQEVLKALFPKRKFFHYEEALYFHDLWLHYFKEIGNEIQGQKHYRFILLIMNTLQSTQVIENPQKFSVMYSPQ